MPRRAHGSGRARPRCGRTPVPACSPPPRPSSRACCPWKTHVRQEHGVRGTRAARRLQLTQAADVTPPAHRDPGRRANGTPGAPRPPPRTGRPSGAGLGLGLVSRCPGLSSRLCLHGTVPSHRIGVGQEAGPQAAPAGPSGGQRGRRSRRVGGLTPRTGLPGQDRSDPRPRRVHRPERAACPGPSAATSALQFPPNSLTSRPREGQKGK